jgi:hypothetical protein
MVKDYVLISHSQRNELRWLYFPKSSLPRLYLPDVHLSKLSLPELHLVGMHLPGPACFLATCLPHFARSSRPLPGYSPVSRTLLRGPARCLATHLFPARCSQLPQVVYRFCKFYFEGMLGDALIIRNIYRLITPL